MNCRDRPYQSQDENRGLKDVDERLVGATVVEVQASPFRLQRLFTTSFSLLYSIVAFMFFIFRSLDHLYVPFAFTLY